MLGPSLVGCDAPPKKLRILSTAPPSAPPSIGMASGEGMSAGLAIPFICIRYWSHAAWLPPCGALPPIAAGALDCLAHQGRLSVMSVTAMAQVTTIWLDSGAAVEPVALVAVTMQPTLEATSPATVV